MEVAEPANHVQRMACRCGPPPEKCLPDDTVLVQFTWKAGTYRDAPRADRDERGMSVLVGPITVAEAAAYVQPRGPVEARQLQKADLRLTTAGKLRAARFAVVHTPGRVTGGIQHATVVWPDTEPLTEPDGNWNTEVSAMFNSCFNKEEEG